MAQLRHDPSLGHLLTELSLPEEPFASYNDLESHCRREVTQEEFLRSFGIEVRLLQLLQIGARLKQGALTTSDLSKLFAQRRASADASTGEAGAIAREIWIAMGTHGLWGGHIEKQLQQLRGLDGAVTWRDFMLLYFKDMEAVDLFSRSVAVAMDEQQAEEPGSPLHKGQVKKSAICATLDADEDLMDALEQGLDSAAWYTWYTDLEGSDAMGLKKLSDQYISVDDFISSYASLALAGAT